MIFPLICMAPPLAGWIAIISKLQQLPQNAFQFPALLAALRCLGSRIFVPRNGDWYKEV